MTRYFGKDGWFDYPFLVLLGIFACAGLLSYYLQDWRLSVNITVETKLYKEN